MMKKMWFAAVVAAVIMGGSTANAQDANPSLAAMEWRCVGPHVGVRGCGVAMHPTDRSVFFHAHSSGGVWKTEDAGQYWIPIADADDAHRNGSVRLDPRVKREGGRGAPVVDGDVPLDHSAVRARSLVRRDQLQRAPAGRGLAVGRRDLGETQIPDVPAVGRLAGLEVQDDGRLLRPRAARQQKKTKGGTHPAWIPDRCSMVRNSCAKGTWPRFIDRASGVGVQTAACRGSSSAFPTSPRAATRG